MGWLARLGEGAARVYEAKRMSDEVREEFTASVLMLVASYYDHTPGTSSRSSSGGMAWTTDKFTPKTGLKAPGWLKDCTRGSGPVWLAWEAHEAGLIDKATLDRNTWDTVFWQRGIVKGRPVLVRIGKDFSKWKSSVADALDKVGLDDPRDDNRLRGWALAIQIATAAAAVTLIVVTAGVGTPAAIAAMGGASAVATGMVAGSGAVAKVMYAASDRAEQEYQAQAAMVANTEVRVAGSVDYQALGGALGGAASAYATGGTTSDILDASVSGYQSGKAAGTPAVVAPPPAPSTGEQVKAWATSTTGMVTIGVAAVVLVILATRK